MTRIAPSGSRRRQPRSRARHGGSSSDDEPRGTVVAGPTNGGAPSARIARGTPDIDYPVVAVQVAEVADASSLPVAQEAD